MGDQVDLQVTDQVERLLILLRDGPHTAAQLLARLGLSHRPTLRANYLRPALALGLVEMTHPESPTAKNQAYRLTRARTQSRRLGRRSLSGASPVNASAGIAGSFTTASASATWWRGRARIEAINLALLSFGVATALALLHGIVVLHAGRIELSEL